MKRGLQIIIGMLSLIPFMVAILGQTSGLGRWLPAEAITPEFDSHYRYITGFYISLGVIAWWIIPNIENTKRHCGLWRVQFSRVAWGMSFPSGKSEHRVH